MSTFDVTKFDVAKFDLILSRGLSMGLGKQGGQVCIEAAICETLGLEHGDDPKCVAESVRAYKIRLNDSNWSSPKARANGLRELGLAQLGSMGVVEDNKFASLMAERTIRVIIPKLFREVLGKDKACLEAADRCEKEGSQAAAEAAAWAAEAAAWAAWAAGAAAWAAEAAAWAAGAAAWAAGAAARAARAAWAAARAAGAAKSDSYLILSANLAIEVLRELGSPGVRLLA